MPKPIHLTHEFQDVAFRQIEPIRQWSASIALDMPYEDFLQAILLTAEEIGHRYTGTVNRDSHTGNVMSFTHTRFRRNKHGQPIAIKRCEKAMRILAGEFGTVHERELLTPGLSRIMLGLYEGQHASGARATEQGPDYSIEDVKQVLGDEYEISPAEICSIRLSNSGDASHYAEEVACVTFPSSLKNKAYLVGHAMLQERFSVETFAEAHGLSYMVETEWCREPDPGQPVG